MFDETHARQCRALLRGALTGSLATLDRETGTPFASLVTVATAMDGAPVMLLSDLALHTQNLKADPRASVMVRDVAPDGDPLALARVTVSGRLVATEDTTARRRFLARHPEATGYAAFTDFVVYRLEPETVHLVAGFGVIETVPAADVFLDAETAAAFTANEMGAVAHMNDDHADAVELYATKLLGAEGGAWRVTAIDPDGSDLVKGETALRLPFPEPLSGFGALRHTFKALSDTARGKAA